MKMTKIKKDAIEHYNKMIEYVETLNKLPDSETMESVLGEDWYSNYCSYCMLNEGNCDICQLKNFFEGCCSGLWVKMSKARMRKTWLKYAKLVREYIIKNG